MPVQEVEHDAQMNQIIAPTQFHCNPSIASESCGSRCYNALCFELNMGPPTAKTEDLVSINEGQVARLAQRRVKAPAVTRNLFSPSDASAEVSAAPCEPIIPFAGRYVDGGQELLACHKGKRQGAASGGPSLSIKLSTERPRSIPVEAPPCLHPIPPPLCDSFPAYCAIESGGSPPSAPSTHRTPLDTGDQYEGERLDSCRQGHGRLVQPHGTQYENMFADGKFHGEGRFAELDASHRRDSGSTAKCMAWAASGIQTKGTGPDCCSGPTAGDTEMTRCTATAGTPSSMGAFSRVSGKAAA